MPIPRERGSAPSRRRPTPDDYTSNTGRQGRGRNNPDGQGFASITSSPGGRAPGATINNNAGRGFNRVSRVSKGEALNPPFDPRMQLIGSPFNRSSKIKRGWIQSKTEGKRVNFLFNPPAIQVNAGVSTEVPYEDDPMAEKGVGDALTFVPVGMQTATGVTLQYDRTYEMLSPPPRGAKTQTSLAYEYGVFADVMAWYVFLKMVEKMPTSWRDGLVVSPIHPIMSYLFVGPKLYFYGYPDSLNVTYTHFSENMIPLRCEISLGFQMLPAPKDVPDVTGAVANLPGGGGWSSFDLWGGGGDDRLAPDPYDEFVPWG